MNIRHFLRHGAVFAALLVLGLPAAFSADDRQPPSLSEKTSEALKKFPELQAQKPPNFDAMMALVDSVLPTVPPTSYDAQFLMDIKAKLFLQKDQYAAAIPMWEQVVKLQDQFHYMDEKYSNQIVLYLAQIIFQQASTLKNDRDRQQAMINQSLGYLNRYLQNERHPPAETQMFYAQLLYQQAVADEKHLNLDMLKKAGEVVHQAMLQQLNPKEGLYMLQLAIYQQQNLAEPSADLLELMVQKFPTKKDYWTALLGSYLNLAANEKNPQRQREFYIRAINTIERAQKLGFLNDPKINYNLFTIYVTTGQFSTATDILHEGLRKGTIENTLANWRILGGYYQQANKDFQAIDALKEAEKIFPKEGILDLQIGDIYHQLNKIKEARDAYARAVQKGSEDPQWKPHAAWQLLAYADMELEDWDGALKAITQAAKYPEFAKDHQMVQFKKYIEDTVREREEARKAKEEQKKKNSGAEPTEPNKSV